MNYILYNPLANNGQGEVEKDHVAKVLKDFLGEFEAVSLIGFKYNDFIAKTNKDTKAVIVGGDGTINWFANETYGKKIPMNFYLYKGGTGNDFINDVSDKVDANGLVLLNPYIEKLPKIYVNGMERRYINGIGYGIDGQCCVVANKLKEQGKEKISYAGISIKLMFKGYHCPNAEVIVDGKTYTFKKVWLASGMNGRYYGGGMKVTPEQERLSDELSICIFQGSSKVKTLMIFPSIFKGEHVKKTKYVHILKGKDITVKFDTPTPLQIDGEVVENVSEYRIVKD